MLLCPEVAKLRGGSPTSGGVGTDDVELWKPFKDALTVFTAKGLGKQKDLKKNHSMLARLMGLALDEIEPAQACGGGGSKRLTSSSSSPEADGAKSTKTTTNGSKAGEMATKKKLKSNRPGDKEKKEAKKRRMTASGEGFGGVTFAQVDMDIDVAPEAEPSSSVVAKEKVGERKKRRKDSETMKAGSHDTNGNQVEQEVVEEEKGAKSKKEKKKKLKKKDKNSVEEVSEDVPTAAGNLAPFFFIIQKNLFDFQIIYFFFSFLSPLFYYFNLINIDCRRRVGRVYNTQKTEKEADDSRVDNG